MGCEVLQKAGTVDTTCLKEGQSELIVDLEKEHIYWFDLRVVNLNGLLETGNIH